MNSTSNSTYNFPKISKMCNKHEVQDISFRLGFAFIFILCLSIFCNMVFSFFENNPKVHSKLKNLIEFLRSVLAGVIISLFFIDQITKTFISEAFPGGRYYLFIDMPFFLITFSYIITTINLILRKIFMKKVNEVETVSNDVETFLLENNVPEHQEFSQLQSNILEKLSKIFNSLFNAIRKKTGYVMEQLEKDYEPLAYTVIVFIHAFFAGVGFNGRQYFGWVELIIVGHKIVEIFRVKQACKDLNISSRKSFLLMAIFIFITPICILFRKYAMIVNLKFGNYLATEIFDNHFAQSFFIMSFMEFFIPFPRTWLDFGLNWLTTGLSYMYFKLYFEKNDITL